MFSGYYTFIYYYNLEALLAFLVETVLVLLFCSVCSLASEKTKRYKLSFIIVEAVAVDCKLASPPK